MARPKGRRMNGAALRAVLLLQGKNLTEGAAACSVSLGTLSSLAKGEHGASNKIVRQICDGLGVDDGVLFPTLAGFTHPEEAAA